LNTLRCCGISVILRYFPGMFRMTRFFLQLVGIHCINKAEGNHLPAQPQFGSAKNKQAARLSTDGLQTTGLSL
jgi:hypothetical protein